MPNPDVFNGNLYGGLRARAIRSSIFHYIHDNVSALGWMNTGKGFTPVKFIDEIPAFTGNESISLNTLALIDGEETEMDIELGSYNGESTWTYAVDFYAESDSVGLAVIKDVQKILEGRMPGLGIVFPVIPIYDYSFSIPNLATPTVPVQIGYLDVENVVANRISGPQKWQRYWYTVQCEMISFSLT